jgi:RNA polymerase sigma-70 factor (ECF subfamily)
MAKVMSGFAAKWRWLTTAGCAATRAGGWRRALRGGAAETHRRAGRGVEGALVTDFNGKPREADSQTSSGLLRGVQARDQAAWQRLVALYGPLVYRWCRLAGLQPADAADVGQEVFRAVARKVDDFRHGRPGDTFRGWLRAITRNKLRDHARARAPERTGVEHLDACRRPGPPDPGAESEAAETRLLYRRVIRLVRAEFGEASWQAFWRVAVEGQRPADVARDLGTSLNAVYLAKARVLRRLRTQFDDLPA